jgi:hypothetical protein
VLAVDHSLVGIILLVLGAPLWLAGHWHYALRHYAYKSPLPQRAFQQILPRHLDPTRGLGLAGPHHRSTTTSLATAAEVGQRRRSVPWWLAHDYSRERHAVAQDEGGR